MEQWELKGRDRELVERVQPYTMTKPARLLALRAAVQYVERHRIPGDVVECGVWRGGSSMMAALTLAECGSTRDVHLFDTFEGMTEPTEHDRDLTGAAAAAMMATEDRESSHLWAKAPLEDVQRNMTSTGFPQEHVHYVVGRVEDTLPQHAPDQVALLRLDTDWYASTKHELEHLVPRIAPHGVLIIDDYGYWQGARQAVDEWLAGFDRPVLLQRIDFTGRMAVIPPPR